MKGAEELIALADRIDACVEDAKRPMPHPAYEGVFANPDPRIICLAYGLAAVSQAIRALSQEQPNAE